MVTVRDSWMWGLGEDVGVGTGIFRTLGALGWI